MKSIGRLKNLDTLEVINVICKGKCIVYDTDCWGKKLNIYTFYPCC